MALGDLRRRYSPPALYVLSLMVFWGQIQNYMMRISLNLIIVAMAREPEKSEPEQIGNPCLSNTTTASGAQLDGSSTSFEWGPMHRSLVLSATSYGYISTQLIGGRLAEKFGFKKVYGLSMAAGAVISALSPWVAHQHVAGFIALRVALGACLGVTFPSLHAATARWVPADERSRFISRSYMGTIFGLCITFPMCGAIMDTYGWEVCFYVIAILTGVWFVFWWLLVFDSPEDHPRIAVSERSRLVLGLHQTVDLEQSPPIPWRAILTSAPVWGVVLGDIGNSWGMVSIAMGPQYLKYMLGVESHTKNGIYSGLPWICRYVGGVLLAYVSDLSIQRKYLQRVTARRIFNTISQLGPALALSLLTSSGCAVSTPVLLMCIGMFLNGAFTSGHFASAVDLSPNFAGTLLGIENTAGSACALVAPIVIGLITEDNMTFPAWTKVFAIAGGIYFIFNILYVVMIRGEVQEWNYQKPDAARNEEEMQEKKSLKGPE